MKNTDNVTDGKTSEDEQAAEDTNVIALSKNIDQNPVNITRHKGYHSLCR